MLRRALLVLCCAGSAAACTSIIVGKAASTDGSVMCSHSDDGEQGGDARLLITPAADHAPGTMRPIHTAREAWPWAGPGYDNQPVIGHIPEVAHTFARYSANYGIMNEKQVGMAESTCSGVFLAASVDNGGGALLSIDALSRIALERCETARCAVQTMGDLGVKYGFYGASSTASAGAAESQLVIDKQEGWIFHILPDNTGKSAIWAAERVDDDKVAVVSNMFTIRNVNLTDSARFLGSNNMHDIAQNVLKVWKPEDGLLDFTRVYSDGEYSHKFYSGRRMWGGYRLMGIDLPDTYGDLKFEQVYGTQHAPGRKLAREDLFKVHRYHYEGTKYSTASGAAAGPWGNPDRWNSGSGRVAGNWERTIGIYRTVHTHVVQTRSWLPDEQGGLVWFAPHSAPGSVFVPFAAGCTMVAPEYTVENPNKLSRDSAYWAHRYVFNVMHIKYSLMLGDVASAQADLEKKSAELVKQLDALAASAQGSTLVQNITAAYAANAAGVVRFWWTLPDFLIAKYADGYLNDNETIPYSDDWLQEVGYASGPPPVPCPPCPCAPVTSTQCAKCCGPNATAARASEPRCSLRECLRQCDAAPDLRQCARRCDRRCA